MSKTRTTDATPELERELATLEPSWARCAAGFRTLVRIGHKGELRVQPLASVKADLDRRREQYRAGDTLALLQAVEACAEENIPLPAWLAEAFAAQLRRFVGLDGDAASLDTVFASPVLPTNTPRKAASAKLDWQLGTQLYQAVGQRVSATLQGDPPRSTVYRGLDPVLREVIEAGQDGRPWGASLTAARELVEMIDRSQSTLTSGRVKPLSAFWLKA